MNKIKALIFDYDGVIANSDPFNKKALKYAAESLDLTFNDNDFRNCFPGRTLLEGAELFLRPLGKISQVEKFIKLKRSFDKYYPKEVVPFTETLDFIKKNQNSYRLCIASGSRRILIEMFIQEFKLENMFEFFVSAEDCKKGKPDPKLYNIAISKLKLPREQALIIEDAPLGIEAALKAGIKCLAITYTHEREELLKADVITDSLLNVDLSKL